MPTNPYTNQAIANYNNNPPPDDGTTGSDNQLEWAKHKTKLADPVKTLAENINSQSLAAFAKTINTDDDEKNSIGGSVAFTKSELTLATTDDVTPTRTIHTIDTNADAATDDLAVLATGSVDDGAWLALLAENSSRTVRVLDSDVATATAANISLNGNKSVLLNSNFPLLLRHDGATWYEWIRPQAVGNNFSKNPSFSVAQRGTSFTSATNIANNDGSYLLDQWVLLSDGNDIVDVTQGADGACGNLNYLQADVETVQKKFGFAQFYEQKDIASLLGENSTVSVSFNARVSDASKLDNIKAVVLSWTSTADAPTKDIVSAWGAADTTPTWVANYTAENTPANLSVTATDTRFKIENIAIDASGVKNLVLFIWSDAVADNDTAGTLFQMTDVKIEPGSAATDFKYETYAESLSACLPYFERLGGDGVSANRFGSGGIRSTTVADCYLGYSRKRAAPGSITFTSATSVTLISDSTGHASTSLATDQETVTAARLTFTKSGAGMTAGQGAVFYMSANTDYIDISSELGA